MKHSILFWITCTLLLCTSSFSQNETTKWYFGTQAALDLMTNPPAVLNNSALFSGEGSASIADASGNLLFYTNGVDIWNQQHTVMANGMGVMGYTSSTQSSLIVKQPGSANLYYVFITEPALYYSVVDMSLAAGMGSVTTKNILLTSPTATMTEKLTGVKHCNGVDYWILVHDGFSPTFRAFLLTSSGINPVPVVSITGSASTYMQGYMKVSPNGRKLGLATSYIGSVALFELYDFDNAAGVVSNSLSLISNTGYGAYGCEFSPDGTKFYGSAPSGRIFQWDMCAGSNTAIVASQYSFAATSNWAMQLAPNGKIYIASGFYSYLSEISNPNLSGAACGYTSPGPSVGTAKSQLGLPNIVNSFFAPPLILPSTTHSVASSVSCNTASFSVSAPASSLCAASLGYSVSSIAWNFGDPQSAAANTSTLANPEHLYKNQGSYTAKAILYYTCHSDTITHVITINQSLPVLNLSGNFTMCPGQSASLSVSGASLYTWSSGATGSTVVLSPTVTTSYSVTGTTNNCPVSRTFTVVASKCTGLFSSGSEANDLKLYPNPASSHLSLETVLPVHITLYDLSGRPVLERAFPAGTHVIDISGYSSGLYLSRCVTQNGTSLMRIIKTD